MYSFFALTASLPVSSLSKIPSSPTLPPLAKPLCHSGETLERIWMSSEPGPFAIQIFTVRPTWLKLGYDGAIKRWGKSRLFRYTNRHLLDVSKRSMSRTRARMKRWTRVVGSSRREAAACNKTVEILYVPTITSAAGTIEISLRVTCS